MRSGYPWHSSLSPWRSGVRRAWARCVPVCVRVCVCIGPSRRDAHRRRISGMKAPRREARPEQHTPTWRPSASQPARPDAQPHVVCLGARLWSHARVRLSVRLCILASDVVPIPTTCHSHLRDCTRRGIHHPLPLSASPVAISCYHSHHKQSQQTHRQTPIILVSALLPFL